MSWNSKVLVFLSLPLCWLHDSTGIDHVPALLADRREEEAFFVCPNRMISPPKRRMNGNVEKHYASEDKNHGNCEDFGAVG